MNKHEIVDERKPFKSKSINTIKLEYLFDFKPLIFQYRQSISKLVDQITIYLLKKKKHDKCIQSIKLPILNSRSLILFSHIISNEK